MELISPEIISIKISKFKNNYLVYIFKRIILKVKFLILQKIYKKNSDTRKLNFDWKSKNFNRIALVNLLLKNYEDPEYLEIGCASNSLFNSIPIFKKVGVDPSSGGNVRKTSDDFFKGNKKNFDVIFIDGLHTYKQVRKDIINSINNIRGKGWIVLHDMIPRDWIEQHVPLLTNGDWTGDVWKVAFEIIKTEGLDFRMVSIDHGVGLIKVNNKKAILRDFGNELKDKQFNYYLDNFKKLPILEWNEALDWINKQQS